MIQAPKFQRAQRRNIKARLALCGPTGSGKTYTALGIAITLAEGGPVAVIDSERSSADRYADKFAFDACPLEHYSPESYMEAIAAAAQAGYPVLVIDSLSHAWDGAEGMLERVDAIAKRSPSKNSFMAWSEGTPLHRRLLDTIISYPGHVVVTMRSKMEYVLENINGKQVPRKVAMAPIQRQGVEYEFDLVGDMDLEHTLTMSKSRAEALTDRIISRPGGAFAREILAWAKGGVDVPATAPVPTRTVAPPPVSRPRTVEATARPAPAPPAEDWRTLTEEGSAAVEALIAQMPPTPAADKARAALADARGDAVAIRALEERIRDYLDKLSAKTAPHEEQPHGVMPQPDVAGEVVAPPAPDADAWALRIGKCTSVDAVQVVLDEARASLTGAPLGYVEQVAAQVLGELEPVSLEERVTATGEHGRPPAPSTAAPPTKAEDWTTLERACSADTLARSLFARLRTAANAIALGEATKATGRAKGSLWDGDVKVLDAARAKRQAELTGKA